MWSTTLRSAAVALVMLSSACAGTDETGPASTAPATSTASTADENAWIVFDDGVEIKSTDDLGKLKGTSPEFVTFVGEELARLSAIPTAANIRDCDGVAAVVDVERFHPDGFAVGKIWACADGGAVVIWTRGPSGWKEESASQSLWTCTELRKMRLPAGGIPECVSGEPSNPKRIKYAGPS